MKMTLRWFGTGFDTVTLEQIRQIPGVKGVITTLYDIPAGEVWPDERIRAVKDEVGQSGLEILGIESVNIHDAIKVGLPERDRYIDNYIKTLESIGKNGIRMVCYNFMPVFDWTRTDLARKRADGSTTMYYDQDLIDKIEPAKMFKRMDNDSNGFLLPGWEPERMSKIKDLFAMYEGIDNEKLFKNMVYFLKAIMPVCEKYEIKMAVHPDDPAWPVFNLPRIMINKENILRVMDAVNHPCNGVTLCTGSLGTNPENDIPNIIRSLKGRIFFAHIRNLKHVAKGKFEESAHLSSDGSLDMFEIIRAFHDIGFDGVIRSDHGRAIWGEKAMPGYGLYDRALGTAYLSGIWEAVEKAYPNQAN